MRYRASLAVLLLTLLFLAVACGETRPAPTPPPLAEQQLADPTVSPTPAPSVLVVGNTDGQGVYVRKSINPPERIKAWPDGTKMIVVGEDKQVEGRTWKNVKDPAGNVGWVPAEYLVVPKPDATPTAGPA